MQLLLIILYRVDLLDEVLSALVELEILHAVVLDATSMERVLAEDIPIFAGLWQSLGDGGVGARLIVAPAGGLDVFEHLVPYLKELGADFANPEVGHLYTIPVRELGAP
ncbi:MAG: hypothetical protein ABIL09_16925 [Gemmatimonadota bacterium]